MRPTLSDIYRLAEFSLCPLARLFAPLLRFFQRDASHTPADSAPGRFVYCHAKQPGLHDRAVGRRIKAQRGALARQMEIVSEFL